MFRRLKSRAFFKPFSIIGVLFALQEANGVNSMLIYLVQILEMSGSTVEPKFGTILAGVCRLLTAGIIYYIISLEIGILFYSFTKKKIRIFFSF